MKELFESIDDFRRYVQGVDGTMSLETLQPALAMAGKAVTGTVGSKVMEALPTDEAGMAGKSLRFAVANYAMYKHLIFWSTSRNNTDQKLYKYQYEEIKEEYIAQFWAAMDTLLAWLDDNPDTGGYKEGRLYVERQQLPVRNAAEFDYYYGIDCSQYFYSKVLFLLRKVYKGDILPRTGALDRIEDPILADKVKRCLCYHVMAEAVMKFDLTELPRSIRWDLTHEFSKQGSQTQVREKLYANLMNEVNAWYEEIESAVAMAKGGTDRIVNRNEEKNKFYAML